MGGGGATAAIFGSVICSTESDLCSSANFPVVAFAGDIFWKSGLQVVNKWWMAFELLGSD